MLTKVTCLHIPPLYEEGSARIMWESTDGADGYELDVHYDEDFEAASIGKTWGDIDISGHSVSEIEAMNLTWEQIAKLSAHGFSWRNIGFHNPAWSDIDASQLSWKQIQSLPVEFTEYKGKGEKTQGPDQGLTWSNINSSGLNWSQIEALCWDWETFMFQPSVGINWSQIHSDNLSWVEIDANGKTWHEFERQAARGLGWGSLDGRFLNWSEIEAKKLDWKQFEHLPSDSKTHIAYYVNIPIYKKRSIFRVRAYKDNGKYSDYLTSTLINTLPRSLAKYKIPCLHIPELHEGKTAEVIWGDLYGASGYILERKCGSIFKPCFDGPGELILHPAGCKNPDELYYTPDCKQHFSCMDQVPYYEKTAQYQIKGYNLTDSSQYLKSDILPIIPVFYRDDSVSFSAIKGQKYMIQLCIRGIRSFQNIKVTLDYTPFLLTLDKFSLNTPSGQRKTCNQSVRLTTNHPKDGKLMFKCDRSATTDTKLSAVIAQAIFTASGSGGATVKIY